MHLSGIRCVDERTRQRPWPVFDRVRPRKRQTLPVVWRPPEVRHLLAVVAHPNARRCLRTISAGGRRLRDGTPRQVSDLDAQRRLGRVDQGQGGNARVVPRPPRLLAWWRASWQRGRPRPWVFPARHRPTSCSPTALHKTCTAVVRQRGMLNEASSPTLRHASATHLWARGVALRVMHARLGHQRPRTTARETPLTAPTVDSVHATIKALMAAL
jgi:integrase/recombinase XerD